MKISAKQLLVLFFGIVFLIRGFGTADAYPIQWTVESGGNGHWYDSVALTPDSGDDLTWDEADKIAGSTMFEGMTGYLATLTSSAENQWVWKKFSWSSSFWLGGYQEEGVITSNQNWHWVTGEHWGYTNWGYDDFRKEDEPNDNGPIIGGIKLGEDKLHFYYDNGTWNDISHLDKYNGYIIEFSPVPEPAALLLLGIGLVGFAGVRRKIKRN